MGAAERLCLCPSKGAPDSASMTESAAGPRDNDAGPLYLAMTSTSSGWGGTRNCIGGRLLG